jgi:hypothetical protein
MPGYGFHKTHNSHAWLRFPQNALHRFTYLNSVAIVYNSALKPVIDPEVVHMGSVMEQMSLKRFSPLNQRSTDVAY